MQYNCITLTKACIAKPNLFEFVKNLIHSQVDNIIER
jgi:hypothetical protein